MQNEGGMNEEWWMVNKEWWRVNEEWWMKNDDGWMMMDEWWRIKDDDFKLLRGFASWQTDRLTDERNDIGECRVAFANENPHTYMVYDIW